MVIINLITLVRKYKWYLCELMVGKNLLNLVQNLRKRLMGTSMVVQWLGLHALISEGPNLILGRELRFHKPYPTNQASEQKQTSTPPLFLEGGFLAQQRKKKDWWNWSCQNFKLLCRKNIINREVNYKTGDNICKASIW